MADYHVTSSTELGWRWRSVDGNIDKYKSDLNYKTGFRSFDSSVLLTSDSAKGKVFDTLLVTNSGWGSDPSGIVRVNMAKTGWYKFDSTVRKVTYFNDLLNHALNEHTSDTRHNLGDFDLVILPQNEGLRFNIGGSYNNYRGPGVYTTRGGTSMSDEFPVTSFTRDRANDLRLGAEGKVLGFNFGIQQGFRWYSDRSRYELTQPNVGNNTGNTVVLTTFSRLFPTNGDLSYTQFTLHRTFADRFDFTGRLIYTNTRSTMSMFERLSGRDGSNNFVDLDSFDVTSKAKRLQTRGDIGMTFQATDKFRISDTFSFDRFGISGDEGLQEALYRRNSSGVPLPTTFPRSEGYRLDHYRRYINTVEGDYQWSSRFAFHLGYRYTQRMARVDGFDITFTSPPSGTNPLIIGEEETNHTNAFIGGFKIKPMNNWVIFADAEHGTADNVFTRVENYKYTNFRARTKVTVRDFSLNLSVITRNNSNPTTDLTTPASFNFTTDIKSQTFAGSVDWTPIHELSFSGGYTYRHQTSYTPIILPISGMSKTGFSEFFVRDHYFFLDVWAKPVRRVAIYGSYRIDRDKGQGDLFSTATRGHNHVVSDAVYIA